jgi:hypothetical protein
MTETTSAEPVVLKVTAGELKKYLEAGNSCTILDVRSPQAWESSPVKIRGAIRVDPRHLTIDPAWPKDRCTVTYCT